MNYPLEQLAGHGKNPRAIQKSLPLEQCDTLTYFQESEALPSQPSKLVELKPRSLSKSIPMPKPSCDRTGEIYQSTKTSELTNVLGETSTLRPLDFHARVQVSQVQGQDLTTNIVDFGLKHSESSTSADQGLSSSKTPQDYSVIGYSIEEWIESFGDFPKAGTMQNGRLFPQPHLKPPTVEKGFLSLPTPNASKSTGRSRPAGQTKCETWFKNNGLLADSQCLSPQTMAQLLGFPMDWTRCLWESKEDRLEELEVDTYSEELLCLPVQRSPLEELSISIPASSAVEKLPLEREISQEDSNWIELYDRLADLQSKADFIRATGPVAQSGVWIEYGKVSKRKFRQAYYRSNKAIFPAKRQSSLAQSESGLVKRQYIGEENSKEVKRAGEAIARRNELERIGKEIKLIEKSLCK